MTTRSLIKRLDQLTVIETRCWDGSHLRRLTPIDPDLAVILQLVAAALDELMQTVSDPDQQRFLPFAAEAGIDSRQHLLC